MPVELAVSAELRRGGFTLRAEFVVPAGLTVLLGPSGAGKSLTLHSIAGLARLDHGRILLGKRVLADTAAHFSLPPGARRVGYVPQTSALFPHMTVAENVAFALPRPRFGWRRAAESRQRARVAELLALVRLPGFEARLPGTLSGGEAQRVALARALAAEPEAVLLDEPLSALDAPTRTALRDDLRSMVLASGAPGLVVTHDLAEARALADRLVILVRGRVLAQGGLRAVLAAPPTAEAALLCGWRNVVPLTRVTPMRGGVEAELHGGQRVCLPGASRAGGEVPLLALCADRLALEVLPDGVAGNIPADTPGGSLVGTLVRATDLGAFTELAVALSGLPVETPPLALTCSPREWSTLAIEPGAAVRVRIPPDASRLVARS